MTAQTEAYGRLEAVTQKLSGALTQSRPERVESLSKAGEVELTKMRSRLLEITNTLTGFAEARMNGDDSDPLTPEVRDQFDAAAKRLIEAARRFEVLASKANNLAVGGTSFAVACIQTCGIPPTTYAAPVIRYTEGATGT